VEEAGKGENVDSGGKEEEEKDLEEGEARRKIHGWGATACLTAKGDCDEGLASIQQRGVSGGRGRGERGGGPLEKKGQEIRQKRSGLRR